MSTSRQTATVFLVLLMASQGYGQIPNREIGGEGRSHLKRPTTSPPSYQAGEIRKKAEALRFKATNMLRAADDMRDSNKDTAADELDQRAEAMMERARSLEYQARQIELSGGQHPERVSIPDL